MGTKKYVAAIDTTIVNAYQADLTTRGTGSNMGYADSVEIFSIFGQVSSSTGAAAGQSQELSRALIKFPTTTIQTDRTAGTIPASGSVSFYLKMYNAEHPFTLPQGFNLVVAPVSRSWIEGTGLDMDNYQDLGSSNWLKSDTTTSWTSIGGDYLTASNYNVAFPMGYENIDLDVTQIVEQWLTGTYNDYGLGIHLTASQEAYFSSSTGADTSVLINNTNGARQSYYTKRFFARSSNFFFKRPVLEARWDSRILDDRENFFYSSSLAPAADNLNTLYLYNYVRGRLVDIPTAGDGLYVSFYSSSAGVPTGGKLIMPSGGDAPLGGAAATATSVSTGIYSVTLALTAAATPLAAIHDVWAIDENLTQLYTGSFYPEKMPTYAAAPTFTKVTSCKNLKKVYSRLDKARFRFFVRSRDWSPTIYTVATAKNPTEIMPSASYSVWRVTDNYNAVSYGTGSEYSTYLSYDKDGNYFDFDLALLEAGYMYEIKLSYYNDSIGSWQEQPQTFKFRVEE